MADPRQEEPVGRGHPGARRHDHRPGLEELQQAAGVDRTRPAHGHQRDPPQVIAAPHRHQPDRLRHLGVDDVVDAGGRPRDRQAQRPRDPGLDRLVGQLGEQRESPAGVGGGVEVAQHDAGVGHRGLAALAPVAGRAGVRARALGPDLQAAGGVEPGDAAPAGADGVDVDHGHSQRVPAQPTLRPGLDTAPADQRHVEAGPAHVHGHDVVEPGRLAGDVTGDHSGRRPRQDGPHRAIHRRPRRGDPAVGLHDLERTAEALGLELAPQVLHVRRDDRPQVRVERRDHEPLVLAELGIDRGGERDLEPREVLADQRRGALLVGGIEEGEEVADRDGGHPGVAEAPHGLHHGRLVERPEHRPRWRPPVRGFPRCVAGERGRAVPRRRCPGRTSRSASCGR